MLQEDLLGGQACVGGQAQAGVHRKDAGDGQQDQHHALQAKRLVHCKTKEREICFCEENGEVVCRM